jgi:hypothetical protein
MASKITNLVEDHGGDLLGGEGVGAAEVLDLDLGVAVAIINDLEGPRVHVLLDDGVLEAATDQTPGRDGGQQAFRMRSAYSDREGRPYLMSKMVFTGFMAAWFLAASPIRRSSSVKETNEGVVKLPCSLAMISTLVPSYVATQE